MLSTKADAAAATSETQRKRFRKVAAEELRHHKGFVTRLEALGADPERAMRPYREALDADPAAKRRAAEGARRMIVHMLWSGRRSASPMVAFVRLGKVPELFAALAGGHARRMRAVGLGPLGLPLLVR
ncbi:MAG: ferritin-like fold-containing protein [Acidimicrobiales bacterium]